CRFLGGNPLHWVKIAHHLPHTGNSGNKAVTEKHPHIASNRPKTAIYSSVSVFVTDVTVVTTSL
ncbi:MAG TPA: hypothetical protein PLQ85_07315, partial [Anaerolineae bacterium]|nr:hypothetical protein [Anaerolineae bacterium]